MRNVCLHFAHSSQQGSSEEEGFTFKELVDALADFSGSELAVLIELSLKDVLDRVSNVSLVDLFLREVKVATQKGASTVSQRPSVFRPKEG